MKNRLFMLGILVIALVFGMTVMGCGGDDDDDDTYSLVFMILDDNNYSTVFGKAVPNSFEFLSGDYAEMFTKVESAMSLQPPTPNSAYFRTHPLLYSEIEPILNDFQNRGGITSAEKQAVLNFLNNNGYVIAVTDFDGKTISGMMNTASQTNATLVIAIGKD